MRAGSGRRYGMGHQRERRYCQPNDQKAARALPYTFGATVVT
jgi:hypothetical protein